MENPRIIQGGMGVAVSNWTLAHAVASRGQMGVVSGTGIDAVLARRLQLGDVGGHLAEAMAHFPIKEMAERIWDRYFIPGGKSPSAPFKSKPMPSVKPGRALQELLVVANFVEVWLAKKGHNGLVGINLLEKIQLPTIPSLYGAMLAKVDYVLMGAGIPRAIPGVLKSLSEGKVAEMPSNVVGGESAMLTFDPGEFLGGELPRPKFLGIVSSASLAQMLARKCDPPADGFVIEGPTAGGHNAPPRGTVQYNEKGEPIYGDRDVPELEKFRDLGLPFWMAGSYGSHGKLQEALAEGAQGIQVGTAFAFCDESGIVPSIKQQVINKSLAGEITVHTDAKASPTSFPFKVVQLDGTLSDSAVYKGRNRICDLGYLRETYLKADGSLGYRCPAEPGDDFVKKGGAEENLEGRMCVCNGLMATAGLAQVRDGEAEPILITAGDEVANLRRFIPEGKTSYTAEDVLNKLLIG